MSLFVSAFHWLTASRLTALGTTGAVIVALTGPRIEDWIRGRRSPLLQLELKAVPSEPASVLGLEVTNKGKSTAREVLALVSSVTLTEPYKLSPTKLLPLPRPLGWVLPGQYAPGTPESEYRRPDIPPSIRELEVPDVALLCSVGDDNKDPSGRWVSFLFPGAPLVRGPLDNILGAYEITVAVYTDGAEPISGIVSFEIVKGKVGFQDFTLRPRLPSPWYQRTRRVR